MTLVYKDDLLTVSNITTSSGVRKLYVTAVDGESGFQLDFPKGLTVSYVKAKETLLFRFKKADGKFVNCSIKTKMIQKTRHLYEVVDQYLINVYCAVPVLYNYSVKLANGAFLTKRKYPFVSEPDSKNKITYYNPLEKCTFYLCLGSDPEKHLKSRIVSDDILKQLEQFKVTEADIRESFHTWGFKPKCRSTYLK